MLGVRLVVIVYSKTEELVFVEDKGNMKVRPALLVMERAGDVNQPRFALFIHALLYMNILKSQRDFRTLSNSFITDTGYL